MDCPFFGLCSSILANMVILSKMCRVEFYLKFLLYVLNFDSLEMPIFFMSCLPLPYYCICLIGSTKGKLSPEFTLNLEVVVGGQGSFAIWNIFLVCVLYHCAFGGLDG